MRDPHPTLYRISRADELERRRELADHLAAIAQRSRKPTDFDVIKHALADFTERMTAQDKRK